MVKNSAHNVQSISLMFCLFGCFSFLHKMGMLGAGRLNMKHHAYGDPFVDHVDLRKKEKKKYGQHMPMAS